MFHSKYAKNKTDENKRWYTKQRNDCVSLLRKSKKKYYSGLDVKNITDNITSSDKIPKNDHNR